MQQAQLNEILEQHKLWLANQSQGKQAYLYEADLRRTDLHGANLHGANLCGANLRRADLYEADLYEADLRRTDLHGANLCGAYLCGANLRRADLRGANLRGADLRGADLHGADLRGADLRGADLRGADLWNTIGNAREIQTIQTTKYTISITKKVIQIGCKRHSYNDWMSFSDSQILAMDGEQALIWWNIYKPILKQLIEASLKNS